MEVKKIVEGMTAPQVAQVIDENFNALNGEKATVEAVADVQKNVNRSDDNTGILSYPVFDDTEPVAVGDVRRYEGLLYRAKEAGAHDWDPEKWERVTLKQLEDEKLSELGSKMESEIENISSDMVAIKDSDDESDMQIADEEGNILVEFKDGHIKTKMFDSSIVINQKFKKKKWCSLGTSITWYNNNQNGFEKGYQGWLQDKMTIQLVNKGVNGGTLVGLASNLNIIEQGCDIYTIEHGVNDWGNSIPVGSIDDYINNTGVGTFFGAYRKVIDRIYELNQNSIIIICTPRKSRGFKGFLPESCHGEKSGRTLKDYADAAAKIANRESLFLCDWFNECQVNDHNLPIYSIDDALHPNDEGYKQMAEILIKQFEKIYLYGQNFNY